MKYVNESCCHNVMFRFMTAVVCLKIAIIFQIRPLFIQRKIQEEIVLFLAFNATKSLFCLRVSGRLTSFCSTDSERLVNFFAT